MPIRTLVLQRENTHDTGPPTVHVVFRGPAGTRWYTGEEQGLSLRVCLRRGRIKVSVGYVCRKKGGLKTHYGLIDTSRPRRQKQSRSSPQMQQNSGERVIPRSVRQFSCALLDGETKQLSSRAGSTSMPTEQGGKSAREARLRKGRAPLEAKQIGTMLGIFAGHPDSRC